MDMRKIEDPSKNWTKHEDIVALFVTAAFLGVAVYAAIDLFWLR